MQSIHALVARHTPATVRSGYRADTFVVPLSQIAPNVSIAPCCRVAFLCLSLAPDDRGFGPLSAPQVYFWFDVFCNNQHGAPNLPQLWWKTTFLGAIRLIGSTCLILAPWSDPIPLTRAWCLWEILSTLRCGATLDVRMMPQERDYFIHALTDDLDKIVSVLSRVDCRRSEAWNPVDRDMILDAVHDTVGFTDLNATVTQQMRKWLALQGQEALRRMPDSERALSQLQRQLVRCSSRPGPTLPPLV